MCTGETSTQQKFNLMQNVSFGVKWIAMAKYPCLLVCVHDNNINFRKYNEIYLCCTNGMFCSGLQLG